MEQIKKLQDSITAKKVAIKSTQQELKRLKKKALEETPIKDRWYGKILYTPVKTLTTPFAALHERVSSQMNRSPLQVKVNHAIDRGEEILKAATVENPNAQKLVIMAAKHHMYLESLLDQHKNSSQIPKEIFTSQIKEMKVIVELFRPERSEEDTKRLQQAKSAIDETLEYLTT